jgi:hypothetical protein
VGGDDGGVEAGLAERGGLRAGVWDLRAAGGGAAAGAAAGAGARDGMPGKGRPLGGVGGLASGWLAFCVTGLAGADVERGLSAASSGLACGLDNGRGGEFAWGPAVASLPAGGGGGLDLVSPGLSPAPSRFDAVACGVAGVPCPIAGFSAAFGAFDIGGEPGIGGADGLVAPGRGGGPPVFALAGEPRS